MTYVTLKMLPSWLTSWTRKPNQAAPSPLPLGISEADLAALKALRSTQAWPRYLQVLARLGEQQASELASGLPHDRYLFASGALTALRRVYTLVDDIVAAATKIEELEHARDRKSARNAARHADTFVNTPWYDGWRADATSPTESRR